MKQTAVTGARTPTRAAAVGVRGAAAATAHLPSAAPPKKKKIPPRPAGGRGLWMRCSGGICVREGDGGREGALTMSAAVRSRSLSRRRLAPTLRSNNNRHPAAARAHVPPIAAALAHSNPPAAQSPPRFFPRPAPRPTAVGPQLARGGVRPLARRRRLQQQQGLR